ncbi:MAG: hypothetical protein GY851_11010 [bacterium]|nr:hypothetical protein [bacterium]
MRTIIVLASALIVSVVAPVVSAQDADDSILVEAFDRSTLPPELESRNVRAQMVADRAGTGYQLEIQYDEGRRPAVTLNAGDAPWEWSAYAGASVDVTNPGAAPVTVSMSVRGTDAKGKRRMLRGASRVPGGETRAVPVFFRNHGLGPYWGMRGIPERGPVLLLAPGSASAAQGPSLVTEIQVALTDPESSCRILVDNLRVFSEGSKHDRLAPFPFVDRFGQYIHAEWPGKVRDEDAMRARAAQEDDALAAAPALPGRDAYGGWADGPQLEATGWFRVEKVDGRWWFVTPDGHLFFSTGVNSIYHGTVTFTDGRDGWFEWLPDPEGPFKESLGRQRAYAMAEPIGGEGDTIKFYAVNMKRTFGDDWRAAFRDRVYRRLPAWGFNTVGNWSLTEVLRDSPIPFVLTIHRHGSRNLEASGGYWGKMIDVFDPGFAEDTRKSVERVTKVHGENPLVLGYFVDNEMSWLNTPGAALASPPDQPARIALIEDLKAKHGTIEALNQAWEADAADWDALRTPKRSNATCRQDLEAFEYRFARRYFDTVRAALRAAAPNQLYLGCRFTPVYCPAPVLKACAEVADVVSLNLYLKQVPATFLGDIDKPFIIGEFHFGALDRGMFHVGIQGAETQAERAQMYADYVKSVAASPSFVGCHWFQYVDQPLTGRSLDGENYNIGLVSITDGPYTELLDAARATHRELYEARHSGKWEPAK